MDYIIESSPIDIRSGDILVDSSIPIAIGDTISAWEDAEMSSVMPGLVKVEVAFGTLYMDPDTTVFIKREIDD